MHSPKVMQMQAKHEAIKTELQQLYYGNALQYARTFHKGVLFPPPGMWYSEQLAAQMLDCVSEIKRQEEAILQLEAQAAQCAVVLPMLQPLFCSGPRLSNDKRDAILMAVASANGKKRIQEDLLTAYQAVKPASAEYMERLASLFEEKKALAEELFEAHGVLVSEW